jgi:23S rRNA (guanine2445-N2)-methyltransferase / 23S rRNA (guanine2069-N7)-methyltransferase
MAEQLTLFATCPKGLEGLLADELVALGAEKLKEHVAGVSISATLMVAYRLCLWSRLANRILLPLNKCRIDSAQALYDGVNAIDWQQHFTPEQTFLVDFNGTNDAIDNTQFGAQKSKDAIVDQMVWRFGRRPSIDLDRPHWRLHVQLRKDEAIFSLDLGGESLHRRGYRLEGGLAPLKENLAAALLLRADWPGVAARGGALLDPMCGSGTLLIEGALMAMDIAPNVGRKRWGFEHWRKHDAKSWASVRDNAIERRERALARQWPEIRGYDASTAAIRAAEENIERAGLSEYVRVVRKDVAHFVPPTHQEITPGLVITNPPYGERLGEVENLKQLYAHLGQRLREHFVGWEAAVFTGNPDLGKTMTLRSFKQYRLFNGPIPSQLLRFHIQPEAFVDRERAPIATPAREPVPGKGADEKSERELSAREQSSAASSADGAALLSNGAQMFANRLQKNRKRLQKWIEKSGVKCYRLYDADMPEYAVAIDWYDGDVHVAEYVAPTSIDVDAAQQRLRDVMAAVPVALQIAPSRVTLKQRLRQRGSEQYQKIDQRGKFREVREGDARLFINLTDYLDTGLFLDHRPVRLKIAELAHGKRFLNLFCYTATASIHAALGGATSTTSVDLSHTYLEWAKRNFALNGLSEARNHLVQTDCLKWLRECRQRFDLILLDPPTFSNSKRTDDTLDIQRDHIDLINDAMEVLSSDGLLIFSNNKRKFQLDPQVVERYEVEDQTRWSLDPDFERSTHIHQCWFIKHRVSEQSQPAAGPWDKVTRKRS